MKENPIRTCKKQTTVKMYHFPCFRYWLPTFANGHLPKVKSMCKLATIRARLSKRQQDTCFEAQKRNYQNVPYNDTFLQHFWANSNVKGSSFLKATKYSVLEIAPNLVNVSEKLNLRCH